MIAATSTAVIVALISANAAIITALIAAVPAMRRIDRHSQGAYNQTNRIDEVLEGGQTPNMRQMVETIQVAQRDHARVNSEQHQSLAEGLGENHARIDKVGKDLAEHAKDEMIHAWKEDPESPR